MCQSVENITSYGQVCFCIILCTVHYAGEPVVRVIQDVTFFTVRVPSLVIGHQFNAYTKDEASDGTSDLVSHLAS